MFELAIYKQPSIYYTYRTDNNNITPCVTSAMDWLIPFVKLARESGDTPSYFMLNHFAPKISLVILLTVCHIVFFFNVSLENLLLDQLIIP